MTLLVAPRGSTCGASTRFEALDYLNVSGFPSGVSFRGPRVHFPALHLAAQGAEPAGWTPVSNRVSLASNPDEGHDVYRKI